MNIYNILITLIELRLGSPSLYRVLESLGKAVVECHAAIDKASKTQNSDYFEGVVDDESAVIENLLGVAFVACQTEITTVVSHAMRIHEEANAQGLTLASSDGTKNGILSVGNPIVQGSGYTQMQIINAFANYFKHCDEWKQSWQSLTGQPKGTVDIISKVGADEFGTGNIRVGIEALGVTDLTHLESLSEYVSDWINAVKSAYETELRQHNLV